jgi:hypothetical protein
MHIFLKKPKKYMHTKILFLNSLDCDSNFYLIQQFFDALSKNMQFMNFRALII